MLRALLLMIALGCAASAEPRPRSRDGDPVDVTAVIHDAVIDIRHAIADSFTGPPSGGISTHPILQNMRSPTSRCSISSP